MKSITQTPNRLINEKSPYLLQHAHNPVDWYPWGDEAFAKAKSEDKPVFLSIGYSTCHWCHVMERESFEDEEVAKILNKHYISIKVDREERPDIDTIYMAVCQAMTGHGGWPLTVIMTPDKKPFFAGTYFPKHSTRGMPGLTDILIQVAKLWLEDKDKLITSGDEITRAVESSLFDHEEGDVALEALHTVYNYFDKAFDEKYGGFGQAPKFPTPHNLTFLLRYWKLTGKEKALQMVEKTLDAMYQGGIYDHIGFGFSRYSTDKKWLVPHFEKMLYDNSLLAIAYLEAYQATHNEFYSKVAREIFTYVLRDMTSPEGAFYSAEDADSEGEEGKFYVWSPDEIVEVLGEDTGNKYCQRYDITPKGNFEGKNIPNLIGDKKIGEFEVEGNKLFLNRENRIHPFKDDKILTSWNGLMIAALAFGGRVLGEDVLITNAERATQFIMTKLRRDDGRLLARYRDGEAAIPAFVDDYAFLIWGLIELYQASFKPTYLLHAVELNNEMIELFWDKNNGGLYQYGSDAENLITRPKETYDGAIPAGNSVAALNFIRLAHLTGDQKLIKIASAQLTAFGGSINESPYGHTHFLMAVYLNHAAPVDVVIVGDLKDQNSQRMIEIVNQKFSPETYLLFKSIHKDNNDTSAENMIPSLKGGEAIEGRSTAYVCKDFACMAPVNDPGELEKIMQA